MGSREGRGELAGGDDGGATLLDAGDEGVLDPGLVTDNLLGGLACVNSPSGLTRTARPVQDCTIPYIHKDFDFRENSKNTPGPT